MRKGLLAALILSILSSAALARPAADDDAPPPDARTEGYIQEGVTGPTPALLIEPASGMAGTWFITAFLGAICIGVMFKNGKRTHLD